MKTKDDIVCDDWMEKAETRVLVSDIIDSSPLRSREITVLKMRFWQDMTLKCIGAHLNVSGERIRYILCRVMIKLRRTLIAKSMDKVRAPSAHPDYSDLLKLFIARHRETRHRETRHRETRHRETRHRETRHHGTTAPGGTTPGGYLIIHFN